nr:hypothetical protein HCOI_00997000 [Haemonchus contortus]
MDVLFDILKQPQYIKFTREVPHEGWLPYLNTQTKISGEVEREESRKLACEIAKLNDYGTLRKRSGLKAYSPRNRENVMHVRLPFMSDKVSAEIRQCIARADPANDVVLVNLPTDNIKRHLIRNRLYDRACSTNNCVICPFGKGGDCTQRETVYQLQCSACDGVYIGETGRMQGIRVKEHLAGFPASLSSKTLSLPSQKSKHIRHIRKGKPMDSPVDGDT